MILKLSLGLVAALASAVLVAEPLSVQLPIGDPARKDRQVELVLDGITDTAAARVITPSELAASLGDTGLLFIGETHTNIDFHRVQLRVIRELHEAGREVMIGLEMFPYTQQASLDSWIDGHYSEAGFVELGDWYTYWGYNWEYYRDIFLYARENGIRMYAVNTPREVVTAVRKKGFKDLSEEEAAHLPHEVQPVTAEQRRMYRSFFDPEDALHMSDDALEGMLRAQTTWDATMGWNALQALNNHGGEDAIMVVLIGSGHVTYGLGSERQTAPYYDGNIASLIPVEIADDEGVPVSKVQASYANFVWGLPKADDTIYPALGVSLMGALGDQPTQIIQVGKQSVSGRAGIVTGDVLLSLDGEPIESDVQLRTVMADRRWGDVITLGIEREGKAMDVQVPLRRQQPDGDN